MLKKGLGRGLGALIPEVEVADKERESIQEIDIQAVAPNVNQPRKTFDPQKLEELAASIREHGVVQPIVVRARGVSFEIVAGERRWRASQLAGLNTIPALVREFTEAEVMEIALIENLQREDLNPLEEAEAYRLLLEEHKLTQDQLAQRLGKSRPQITNTLRLLQLGPVARQAVQAGRLSMGHAKVLLSVSDGGTQERLAKQIADEGLSVRELEWAMRKADVDEQRPPQKQARRLTSDLLAIERQLQELFGTPVKLSVTEQRGKVEITFFGEEGLERILEVLDGRKGVPSGAPNRAFRV